MSIAHLEHEMSELAIRMDEISRRMASRERESKEHRIAELEESVQQLMRVVSLQQKAIEELCSWYADQTAEEITFQ